ncbi:MAG: ABC transporter ATP-binding protein [Vicinamibacterales bacterium]
MAAIALQSVSKRFPGHAAVRDVTLEVAAGELLVLVGPSGCGKSTVLRLIAGLETPTAGRIVIGGHDVTALPPQQRDVAMVFQSYALYPHKTVRDNLAFGLRMRGVAADEIARRVDATARALGLDVLLDRRPGQLSGGQRQRAALGRALVREPQAFLLDEPLSNLDPVLRLETRTELALLHRRLAATMVYVTHDQEEAMTLGTRVAVMRQGVVEQVAPPLAIYARPANVFVAGFVGSPAMNLWPATVVVEDGRRRLGSPVVTFDLPDEAGPAPAGGAATIGVRPHDLDLVGAAEADASGQVAVVEPLGATAVVHVRLDALADRLVRAVVPADRGVGAGERVHVRLRRERVHLFDAESGAAWWHGGATVR